MGGWGATWRMIELESAQSEPEHSDYGNASRLRESGCVRTARPSKGSANRNRNPGKRETPSRGSWSRTRGRNSFPHESRRRLIFSTISKCCADSGDESGCFYIWWAVRPPWPLPPRTHGLFFGIRAVIAQYEPVTTHERTRGQKKRAQRVPVHSERNDGGPSVRRRGALLGKRSLTLADHDATAIIRRARYVGPPRPIR